MKPADPNIMRCAGCGKKIDERWMVPVRRELIYQAPGYVERLGRIRRTTVLKREIVKYCSEQCAQEHHGKLQMAYEG